MKRLALITDDLSSATDCGIQVARSGLTTVVLFGGYERDSYALAADVVSIDTDSRSLDAEEAYAVVRHSADTMLTDGFDAVYKSIDSTLRGNLGPEVDAVMDAGAFDWAVIAPAFPLYGRTTVGGRHYLDSQPLTQTEFASDPRAPIQEDDLVALFASQSKRTAGLVPLEILREGSDAVLHHIASLEKSGVELVVFDALVEDDLDRIVHFAKQIDSRILWVGSTGLARCVPDALDRPDSKLAPAEPLSPVRSAMLVAGSASSVTRGQVEAVSSLPNVVAVKMDPKPVLRGGAEEEKELARCTQELEAAAGRGKDLVLHVSSSRSEVELGRSLGRERGLEEDTAPTIIASSLAEMTHHLVTVCGIDGLILTGGDTAKAVCRRLGAVGAQLFAEVEPGIPLGRLLGSSKLPVITKAGGFGNRQSLVNAMERLKKR
jgi:uncharacterized protein YgbK (DUF1537 family)